MAPSRRDLLLGWRRGVREDPPRAEEPSPAPLPAVPRPFVGLRDLRAREPEREGLAHAAARGLDAAVAQEERPPPVPPHPEGPQGGATTPAAGSRPQDPPPPEEGA